VEVFRDIYEPGSYYLIEDGVKRRKLKGYNWLIDKLGFDKALKPIRESYLS
jgi:hypothetical protein